MACFDPERARSNFSDSSSSLRWSALRRAMASVNCSGMAAFLSGDEKPPGKVRSPKNPCLDNDQGASVVNLRGHPLLAVLLFREQQRGEIVGHRAAEVVALAKRTARGADRADLLDRLEPLGDDLHLQGVGHLGHRADD